MIPDGLLTDGPFSEMECTLICWLGVEEDEIGIYDALCVF